MSYKLINNHRAKEMNEDAVDYFIIQCRVIFYVAFAADISNTFYLFLFIYRIAKIYLYIK